MRTLVLNSADSVGQGSNKAAIGGVRATHSDPAKIRLNLRSLEILSTWQEMHGEDIEWNRGGYVYVAYREREERTLKDLLAIQKTYGLNIDWLDREAMLEVLPDLNRDGLMGGTYSADDGHCSTLLTTHAFYDHARRMGAEFRFGEQVTALPVQGGRVRGVVTDRGRYAADVVVNAAGATRSVAKMAGIDVPVTPNSHEAAITEPVAASSTRWWSTSGLRPARPIIISTSIIPARSSSASPRARRFGARTGVRRVLSCRWLRVEWSI